MALAYGNNLLPGGRGGKRGQKFAASTHPTPYSHFTKEIFTATSPLYRAPTPRLTVHVYLAPSGPWLTAGLGLQPADLRDDLSPELTLVLGTIRPLPGLSSPCGTVLSLVHLP